MKQYLALLDRIMAEGVETDDRTGTGTRRLFGTSMRFSLDEYGPGFPLLTTKFVSFKNIFHELTWMLNGQTNVTYLDKQGIHIWDEWADENGDLGPIYGRQWRSWPAYGGRHYGEIDQIGSVLNSLRNDPYSRRHIVSAWNPSELEEMNLPPCHLLFQFNVFPPETDPFTLKLGKPKLSCQIYQRSADMFLGVPYNIASYSLLTMMIAKILDYEPDELIWVGGDTHIYSNHFAQVKEQVQRIPLTLPRIEIATPPKEFRIYDPKDYKFHHFTLKDYEHHPAIKGEISI